MIGTLKRPILTLTANPRGRGFVGTATHSVTGEITAARGGIAFTRAEWRWYASRYQYTLREVRYGSRAL